MEEALKSADLQLVLCSKESVGRPWVNFEAGAVWLRGVPIIPVCHSGMKLEDLPVPLSMLEGVECGQSDGLHKLYETIATELGASVPEVDFDGISTAIREIEDKYIQARKGLRTIANPRILCAVSEQYAEPSYGFDLDVAILKKTFPKNLEVVRGISRSQLRDLLTSHQYDIVHLVMAVDSDTGDLIFSPVDYATKKPSTSHAETISAEAFAALLLESNTSLVVLATCKALLLAVEVAHVSNMAAADADVSGNQVEEWGECFYSLLSQGKSLYKTFELTRTQSDTPIRAIRKKDIVFSLSDA